MKKLKLTSIRAGLDRQYVGDWVPYPVWSGVRFNVSSPKLPAYQRAMEKNAREFAKKFTSAADILSDEAREFGRQSDVHLVCEYILHGWDGIDVDYSPDVAEKYLLDPEYEAMFNAIKWCANKLAEINAEYIEDVAKNSEEPSATA